MTFLQVYEAGHMVPMDQPEAALSMLNTFLRNEPFVASNAEKI
jgi:carboxypeptidase C (cathepsin A)